MQVHNKDACEECCLEVSPALAGHLLDDVGGAESGAGKYPAGKRRPPPGGVETDDVAGTGHCNVGGHLDVEDAALQNTVMTAVSARKLVFLKPPWN